MNREEIIEEIKKEVQKQISRWGEQDHPSLDQVLLNRIGGCTPQRMCEEYGIPSETVAKYSCDSAAEVKALTWAHIAVEELSEVVSEFDPLKRRVELIQLAAVIINWIDSIERNEIQP